MSELDNRSIFTRIRRNASDGITPPRATTMAIEAERQFTALLEGPEVPYIPSTMPHFDSRNAFALHPDHLRRIMTDKRDHLIHRLRNSYVVVDGNDTLNSDSLKSIMSTGWFSRWLWARRTRKLAVKTYRMGVPVRIKDDSPLCWKGRAGYITDPRLYPESPDLMEVSLFGGVVGSPSWTVIVSLYDLVVLTDPDAEFENTQWQRRIRGLESAQLQARRAEVEALQAQERAASGMASGLHAIHPRVIEIAKEEGVYDAGTVYAPLPRTRRKLRGL